MKIAIHNIHLAPNLNDIGISNYIIELISQGLVTHLYFDETHPRHIIDTILHYRAGHAVSTIPWRNVKLIFTAKALNQECDVLLNFNTHTGRHDFTSAVKGFNGLKIWHLGDWFWNQPGSEINKNLEAYGVDYVLGFASHDQHSDYFQTTFPKYNGKVIPVPFGFAPKYQSTSPFAKRKSKALALGAINHLRPLDQPIYNYRETAEFYPDEAWFHKFRRMLVMQEKELKPVIDSILPVFPLSRPGGRDLVKMFNDYKMFVSCESIFFFPPAKSFEGSACGSVMICADHACNHEFGFKDGKNCIMYRLYDVDNFVDKVRYYQKNEAELADIQLAGSQFVRDHYSHPAIAKKLVQTIEALFQQ